MILRQICRLCGCDSEVEVDREKYGAYLAGLSEHLPTATHGVQAIFTDRTADERELILSGIHPACWDSLFKEIGENHA